MRALVTGCTGFIGSTLVDKLIKNGLYVTGIDCYSNYYSRAIKENNISKALRSDQFEFIEKDILEMEHFPEADYVFHQAAQAGVRASWGKSFEIYTRNNVEATQKLLEFYKDKKIRKFVYASSSSIYGDARLPMVEDTTPKPVSPYGVTKLAGEHLCNLYWKNYRLPSVSLRYFTVYGPRQRPDMAIHKFIMAVLTEKKITIYGNGEQKRDFTYVDDVISANLLAAEKADPGSVYNIGGGNTITVNGLIALIEKITGKNAIVEHIESQKGDVENTWASVERARNELGWSPETDVSEGMRHEIDWLKTTL